MPWLGYMWIYNYFEIILKLFQCFNLHVTTSTIVSNYFRDIEHVGKYSWAVISCAATASEVTTLWRDRNVCIIIIIIIIMRGQLPKNCLFQAYMNSSKQISHWYTLFLMHYWVMMPSSSSSSSSPARKRHQLGLQTLPVPVLRPCEFGPNALFPNGQESLCG